MDCKNPCKEYRTLRKKFEETIFQANNLMKDSFARNQSSFLYKKAEERLNMYCKIECSHTGERAKNLLQKL